MKISRRHHYIPRFLINKFVDLDNKVWVYNKEDGRVSKKQSSKSIFFEMERNNFNINGQTSDNLELLYSEVDNMLSLNLDKILSTHNMKGKELTMLILLVTLTKWRIPASDERFKKQYKDMPIEQLGFKIRPIDREMEVDKEEVNRIKELDILKEAKRLLLSIQPLIREESLNDIHKNCFIVSYNKFPSLLGDVPLIENPNISYESLEDFIFPLSSSDTLICKRGAEKHISQEIFYLQRDLTTFHLANKYVVCKSKEHLLKIVEIYSKLVMEKKTNLLTKYIFNFIK